MCVTHWFSQPINNSLSLINMALYIFLVFSPNLLGKQKGRELEGFELNL